MPYLVISKAFESKYDKGKGDFTNPLQFLILLIFYNVEGFVIDLLFKMYILCAGSFKNRYLINVFKSEAENF